MVKHARSPRTDSTTPIAVAKPRLPQTDAIVPYLRRIDSARWYSNFGPLVQELEERLAHRFGAQARAVTCVNATQGLTLTLQALNIAPGTLCAMPSWTFVATGHAAVQAGLTPWFLDADRDSWMLTPQIAAEALARAPGTVGALIVVAPFGRMPDVAAWLDFQDKTGIKVIIDAAAAFDAACDARLPTVVSLHATKVLGMGEGGFVATDNHALAARLRRLTSFGFDGTRLSQHTANNAKISEYAAAVGLASLDAWPGDRLRWFTAAQTLRHFPLPREIGYQPGWGRDWTTSVCVVTTPEGAAPELIAALKARDVDTRQWWGEGCHASPAFAAFPREALPNTEILATSTLGLPFYIDLDRADAARIAEALGAAL
ncbi:DegT/DnrJ/EryC1/StrS family aminotransferase [Caulobacter hibisci]|uniref:DegT/DnrJ/EryC1/StrS family aminotransferase n=1 Tax=Caulobacter hibisci TaxID=2035993 RepID=A0ABS0SZT3_9CAUL|nr:aminotransferase class I/II-fold pyridoxal phosphate-dependent enzyme [Caulobacter hibisci]MBI1684959.1 DegT/DnrJ/EryC1/StrS family aminotransferase [Caulobacter hibisci]